MDLNKIILCSIALITTKFAFAENGKLTVSSSLEWPRLATVGVEYGWNQFSFGMSVGSTPTPIFSNGISIAGNTSYFFPNTSVYIGSLLGWQKTTWSARDVHEIKGPGGTNNWGYKVESASIESALFATPFIGYRFIEYGGFQMTSEIGWYQTYLLQQKVTTKSSGYGNYSENITESQINGLKNSHISSQTKPTIYIVPIHIAWII